MSERLTAKGIVYKTCRIKPRMGLVDVYNGDDDLILAGFRNLSFAKRFVDLVDEMGYIERED